jgi:osmotically-inducible protein OsmY
MECLHKRMTLLAAILCLAGCGSEDTEQLAKVARLSASKVGEMSGGAPNKVAGSFETMRANWSEPTLETRISLRLSWEKDLQDTAIQVRARNGIVTLKGSVRDIAQQQRAVAVARSTIGVVDVVDSLEVVELN